MFSADEWLSDPVTELYDGVHHRVTHLCRVCYTTSVWTIIFYLVYQCINNQQGCVLKKEVCS